MSDDPDRESKPAEDARLGRRLMDQATSDPIPDTIIALARRLDSLLSESRRKARSQSR